MSIKVTAYLKDDDPVRRRLAAMAARVADLQPALREIGETLKANIQMGFRDGADPWGRPWEPLRHRQGQPLRDTGQLMNSINWQLRGRQGVQIGPSDNAGKSRMHQFGGISRGAFYGARIPARPYLPIRDGAVDLPQAWAGEVLEIVNDHIGGHDA